MIWRTLTLILFLVVVIETASLVWLVGAGLSYLDDENQCAINICAEYDSYYYDIGERQCTCYNSGISQISEYIPK